MLSPTFSSPVCNKNLLLLPRFPSVVVAFFACVASVGCCWCCCGVSIRQKRETRREIGLLSGSKWRRKSDIFSYCSQWLRLHVPYIFCLVKFKWNLKSDVISALSSPPFFSSSCIPPTISFFFSLPSRSANGQKLKENIVLST